MLRTPSLRLVATLVVGLIVTGALPHGGAPPLRSPATADGDRILIFFGGDPPMMYPVPWLNGIYWIREWPFAVVLLDGRRDDGTCAMDEVRVGLGFLNAVSIHVGNFVPSDATCPSNAEVAALSSRGALVFIPSPGWTDAGGERVYVVVQPRLRVKLNIQVETGGGTATPTDEFLSAAAIYRNSRTGLKLTLAQPITETTASIGSGCADLPAILGGAGPPYDKDAINVYFILGKVKHVIPATGTEVERSGQNCRENGAPNVIYMALTDYLPTTLAHEIGHALELEHTGAGNGGPSTSTAGFSVRNIMYNGTVATVAESRDHLALGQIYRANIHKPSWLNTPVPGATAVRLEPTKDCGNGFVTLTTAGECPRQSLSWP